MIYSFSLVFNYSTHFATILDLMTHRALQEVLYMVLVAGNFLNSVINYEKNLQKILQEYNSRVAMLEMLLE